MISQVDGENGAVNGSKQLADGAAAVDAGVNQIISQVDGENGAVSGSKQLADGAAAVDAGAKQLADSSNELKTSVDQLANGAAAIDNGLANVQAAYNDRADGTPGLTSGSQAVSDGVNELASQLQSTVNSLKTSVAALSQTITDNNTKIAQCQAVLQGGISPATGQALTETEIQTYTANIQQLSGANAALTSVIQQIQSQLPSEEQQAVMTQKVNALTQGAKNVADGTKQVSAGISQLREQAATPVANGLNQLDSKVPELIAGVEQLKAGTGQDPDALSDREKDVIISLVQGMSNKEIADHLFISVNTVITHRRNIARKLQIHSPAGLTIYAIVNGLVDISSVKF